MKKSIKLFRKLNGKEKVKHILVWMGIVLFLVFIYFFNQGIDKKKLIEENGNQFEKAEVVEIVSEKRNEDGSQQGTQILKVCLKSGKFKGNIVKRQPI